MTMKQVFEKATQDIQVNGKYTLLAYSEFGMPYVQHVTIHKAYISKYAQYDNVLAIEYTPKRKRTAYKKFILPSNTMIIFPDWIDMNTDDFYTVEHRNGMTIKTSRLSFDNNYIAEKVNNSNIKPIAILDRDYYSKPEEIEYIYQVVTDKASYAN